MENKEVKDDANRKRPRDGDTQGEQEVAAAASALSSCWLVTCRYQIAKYDVAQRSRFEILPCSLFSLEQAKNRTREMFVTTVRQAWRDFDDEWKSCYKREKKKAPPFTAETMDSIEGLGDKLTDMWAQSDDCRPDCYSGPCCALLLRMKQDEKSGALTAVGPKPAYRLPDADLPNEGHDDEEEEESGGEEEDIAFWA